MKLYINQEVPELIRHNPGLDIMFKQERQEEISFKR